MIKVLKKELLFILIVFTLGIRVAFAETTIYVSDSVSSSGDGTTDSPVKTIDEALNKISDEGVIVIKDDLTLTKTPEIKGKNITIKGSSPTVKLTWNGSKIEWGLMVYSNGTLSLQDITLDDTSKKTSLGLIHVDKGNLIIGEGTTLQNSESTWNGGAIHGSNANITMNGGTITGNKAGGGGAIFIENNSTFTMNGGTITKNNAEFGAGILAIKSTVNLNGAANIEGNVATSHGGGIVLDDSSTLTMKETATIAKNTATTGGGIFIINQSQFTMNDGLITENSVTGDAGAIYLNSSSIFNGNGGNITKNKTTTGTKNSGTYRGGAIYAENSKLNLKGTNFTENTAVRGGAIFISNNVELTMTSGSINDNIATANAGALFIGSYENKTTTATLSGGEIRNNKNTGTDIDTTENFVSDTEFSAGAIYVGENCNLNLTNVAIYDNQIDQSKFIANRPTDKGMMAGGIGLCPNANIFFFVNDGGAIYHNLTNGQGADILLTSSSTKLPFNSAKMFVSYLSLGNGINRWTDINGNFIEGGEFDITGKEKFVTLISHLNETDIEKAQKAADLFISDNKTNAVYGGGAIMCNGTMTIGTKSPLDDLGGLEVTKEVEGNDTETAFSFIVTLEDKTINGTYGDMEFKDGVATFNLKHGELIDAINLPKGVKFKVEEKDGEKYKVVYAGQTGTIKAGGLKRTQVKNQANIKNPNTSAVAPISIVIVLAIIISSIIYYNKKRLELK